MAFNSYRIEDLEHAKSEYYISGYPLIKFINCSEEKWEFRSSTWFPIILGFLVFLVLFFILQGLVLNTLSMIGLVRGNEPNTLTLLLQHITLCDQCVLLASALDSFQHLSENYPPSETFAMNFIVRGHPIVWMLKCCFSSLRNWTMVLLCTTRGLHFAFPLRLRNVCSRRACFLILAFMWIFTACIYVMKMAETITVVADCPSSLKGRQFHIEGNDALPRWYVWLTSSVSSSVIPIIICLGWNGILLIRIRDSTNFQKHHSPVVRNGDEEKSQQKRMSRRSVRLVLQLTILFVICQGITSLYAYIIVYAKSPPLYILINFIATLINVVDSSCNFFILFSTNVKLRRAVMQTLCCRTFCTSCFEDKIESQTQSGGRVEGNGNAANGLQSHLRRSRGSNNRSLQTRDDERSSSQVNPQVLDTHL